ncbi:MAG: copper-binding protein [Burkholderiales bacterium]|nr:copper-binding protein [Burkholderiales bacterium]
MIKRTLPGCAAALLSLGLLAMSTVGAQTSTPAAPPAQPTQPTAPAQPPAATPMIGGEIRRIDRAGGRVTIRHDEIAHLDMPPMTMVFQASPASLLEGLATGNRIRFRVERSSGALVVTAIEPMP